MGALGLGAEIAPGRRLVAATGIGFDLSGETLPPGVLVKRASIGTCFDSSRTLVTRAADLARIDHDPATGAPRGLLIEAGATNLLPRSADLSTGWTRDAGASGVAPVVTANDAVAPDGSRTAARITFTRQSGFSRIAATAGATVPGAVYTLSVWLKADVAGPSIALRLDSDDSGILTLTTDWRRYRLTANAGSTAASAQLLLWSVFPSAPPTAVVNAWGAQLEAGTRATSLIPTAGAAATRAADQATLNWGAIGVGDGPVTVRYGSDDGSSETAQAMVAGGVAAIPTTLARQCVTSAVRL